jgi:phospholipid N-methyltransferase
MASTGAKFFWQFLRHPTRIGAVAPSSLSLAREMVAWLDLSRPRAVVEYGPGTGTFTAQLMDRLDGGSTFFAIEQNSALVEILRHRMPGIKIYNDTVTNVRSLCHQEGIDQIDCILSGLPWASFSEAIQDEILDSTIRALKPGGQFVTFAYLQGLLLPAGRRFKKKLARHFSEVGKSGIVWMNLPPAFVYRCRK